MKILLGYSYYNYFVDVKGLVEAWLGRLRAAGIDVYPFCLTLNPPGPPLPWIELDARWRHGEASLMNLYDDLAQTVEQYDVFLNWNGINLHPAFVEKLPCTTVFSCLDDPESSDTLSKPVAAAYDLCLIGNIAEVDTYRKWGVANVEFWPLGFHMEDYDPRLTKEDILKGNRDVQLSLLCERESSWRALRLERYSAAFPEGRYYGKGWPGGFIAEEAKIPLYHRTKIGPNFHNSTGPINLRTYMLPANGVMLLCDNKENLGKLFELNKEAVGFETIDEAIELTRYYLSHDEERRTIAAAGWERATREYNELAVFGKALAAINRVREKGQNNKKPNAINLYSTMRNKRLKTMHRRILNSLRIAMHKIFHFPEWK